MRLAGPIALALLLGAALGSAPAAACPEVLQVGDAQYYRQPARRFWLSLDTRF